MADNYESLTESHATLSQQMVELDENELDTVAGGGFINSLTDCVKQEVEMLPHWIDLSGLGKGFGL